MARRHTELEPAVAGDASDYRLIELAGVSTISGATVEGHVWRSGVSPVNLTGSVENAGDTDSDPADKPVIRVNLGSWLESTAVGGFTYALEYEITFGDGRIWTWPSGDPDQLYVREGN